MQPKKKRKIISDDALLSYSRESYLEEQLEQLYAGVKSEVSTSNLPTLISFITNLKSTKKKTLVESVQSKKKCPLPGWLPIPNGVFKFIAPSKVVIAGGVGCNSVIKTREECDLLVHIPDSVFQEKDYLNCRYSVKRTLYLYHLSVKLSKTETVRECSFTGEDPLSQSLQVQLHSGETINLIPVISEGVFRASHLDASKNCIRPTKLFGESCEELPTPHYNRSILRDVLSEDLLSFFPIVSRSTSLGKAHALLKLWCERKALPVTSHQLLLLLRELYTTGTITADSPLLGILKQVWTSLPSLPSLDDCGKTEVERHTREVLGAKESLLAAVFTEPILSPLQLYDTVYTIPVPASVSLEDRLQFAGDVVQGAVQLVRRVLTTAYTDRVERLKVWSEQGEDTIRIALSVNQATATRQIDKGPSADAAEAADFREFWGDRCEVRRFQDGSILQAVLWSGDTAGERRSILSQITAHALARHVGIDHVTELRVDTSSLLSAPWYTGEGDEQAHQIRSTFAQLSKILRSLTKVPLSTTSLVGVSPAFRHTALYPAAQYSSSFSRGGGPPVRVHEVVGRFEASGKWPEDVRAILRLKTAFYLAIKEELASLHITARVNPDYLDIARGGFVFRLRFYVAKEAKLRDANISFWQPSSGDDLRVQTDHLPLVAAHLGSLCAEHPALPLTVRLLKRWVSGHHLSLRVPGIFCELVTAHLFLSSSDTPPLTPTAGLLRLLCLLASHDWQLYPLVLNFRGELGEEALAPLDRFITERKGWPAAAIVCPGNERSQLTLSSPDRGTLTLLGRLAGQSLRHSGEMEDIFRSDLRSSCNALLHLKPLEQQVKPGKNHSKGSYFPRVEFTPHRRYVEDLTAAYGDSFSFLFSEEEPDVVGVVNRIVGGGEEGRLVVNRSKARMPSDEKGAVKFNLDAALSDFSLLGKGLVKSVEVLSLEI